MFALPKSIDELRKTWVVAIPLQPMGDHEFSDFAVCHSAKLYAAQPGVDRTRKFWCPLDLEAQHSPEGWAIITRGCLSNADELDTLVLASHGNDQEFGHWSEPDKLAVSLEIWGLRQIGELRFAACLVGKGTYLRDFKIACTKRGIGVKKFVAYTDEVATVTDWGGRVIEVAGILQAFMGKEWSRVELPGN